MGDYSSDAVYDESLKEAVAGAAVTGPFIISPIPGADLLPITRVWIVMTIRIAEINNVQMDKATAAKIATAVLAGGGAYMGSIKIFLFAVSKLPGIGWVAGSGINSVANVAMTLWLGFALIDLFDQKTGPKDLEEYINFLLSELKPRNNAKKIARIAAFIKRLKG